MLLERYQHPNGQLPAYEWNFDDVNPPVHAWAALFNYRLNREQPGRRRRSPFLKRTFHMLLSNFTWWLNRKDRDGRNLFEGGFLGLDNIGVFDRSAPLPTGGYLEQADGTAWMAFYAQNMLDMALELALVDPTYEELAVKFYEHVISIAAAINRAGAERRDVGRGGRLLLRRAARPRTVDDAAQGAVDGRPAAAVRGRRSTARGRWRGCRGSSERVQWFNENRPDLLANIQRAGTARRRAGATCCRCSTRSKLRRVLARMLDPERVPGRPRHPLAVARTTSTTPTSSTSGDQEFRVDYLPAESDTGMFGGNSNWRGPDLGADQRAHHPRRCCRCTRYYGDEFKVECPTGSGQHMNLYEVAEELANRLGAIFLRDHEGRRPVYGGSKKFADDPHWRDHVLFYEYFHGDNGAGLGASHQTGWTAIIPALMQLFASITPGDAAAPGRSDGRSWRRQPGARRARSAPVNHPLLYQLNTRVFLQERGVALGRAATLDDVPDAFLDDVAAQGVRVGLAPGRLADRPVGREVSRSNPKLRDECRRALPDLRDQDICGSPFAITAYQVHEDFGGDAALRAPARAAGAARAQAAARLRAQPHRARSPLGHRAPGVLRPRQRGRPGARAAELRPRRCGRTREEGQATTILAYGRDPYFAGWPDTFQLNYRHAGLREAQIGRARARSPSAATACAATWRCCCSRRSSSGPGATARCRATARRRRTTPFWPEAIAAIRRRHPQFLFIAEVYWDMEWELQQAGFDYTYDKRLYDRLVAGAAAPVREHLLADPAVPGPLAALPREPRRAARGRDVPARGKHKAAAVVASTARGLRFFHEGQLRGAPRARVDAPRAPPAGAGRRRPARVLRRACSPACSAPSCTTANGSWRRAAPAWDGNPTHEQLIVSSWQAGERRLLVAVNYGASQAQGYVTAGMTGHGGAQVHADRSDGRHDIRPRGRRYRRPRSLSGHAAVGLQRVRGAAHGVIPRRPATGRPAPRSRRRRTSSPRSSARTSRCACRRCCRWSGRWSASRRSAGSTPPSGSSPAP